MKEEFIKIKFSAKRLGLIQEVNKVLDKYHTLGFTLSGRQVYYQLVARNIIPNDKHSYKRLNSIISDGRKAGLIDWAMIVDRTRGTREPPHWDKPLDILEQAVKVFAIDKWADQSNHIEIMVEKDALAGILNPVCQKMDVNFTANRGYSSDSLLYETGLRIYEKNREGKIIYIAYFGDHDPSGLDMDRDILERLKMYSGVPIEVKRLALLMDQIEEMDVPENPAKTTDSRYEGYIVKYGISSWELDAVEPPELERLVTEFVEGLRDPDPWDAKVEIENGMKQELQDVVDAYKEENPDDEE
ncbi:hypothetical protein LCGC14_1822950 [marine sediment metagenome]|uniref:DUF2399 domain-containing protein n=1 Tax=marine sediment metagenome TaxID=412755 RepID=A0A0F9H6I8_9ZZZZ